MARRANRMIVEGEDDKFAIIELMGHHTDWPDDKTKAPVWLEAVGDAGGILADGYITAKLQESGTSILGIVFDADEQFASRWSRIKQICDSLFDDVPPTMPNSGLILANQNAGTKLGVWIMPDNNQHGMIETFLQGLIEISNPPPVTYAKSVVAEARNLNAPYRDAHIVKAEIHSWLAWQDPPGQPLGRAITTFTLNPHAASAKPFVEWFLDLYGLEPKN